MNPKEEMEMLNWVKLNLPKLLEHNEPSVLTKEMFKNLNQKFDDLKADTKESIKELTNEIKEGFAIMHAKQDKTNGKVLKNTAWRQGINGALKVANIIMLPIILAAIIKYLV